MKMYSMKVRDLPVRQVLFLVFLKNLCSDIYRMDSNPSNPILEKILPSTANNAITYASQFLYDETRLFGQLATPQCT